jgi:hypothetical protein
MQISDFEDRRRASDIAFLFRTILFREPDDTGWTHYYNSDKSIDEIKQILQSSDEHMRKQAYKTASARMNITQIRPWLFIGPDPCPGWEEFLISKGFTGILCLSPTPATLDRSKFGSYVQVPVKDVDRMPKAAIFDILDRMRDKGLKVLIHSKLGHLVAPTAVAMYLSAREKKQYHEAAREVMQLRPLAVVSS